MSEPLKVSLISLGCPKNLVDSEVLLGHAAEDGFRIARDPEDADLAVVNTCGFIEAAREESVRTIREVGELKKSGRLKGLVVVGCMSERFGEALREELPEVDAFLGLSDYSGVPALLRRLAEGRGERSAADVKGGNLKDASSDRTRLILTPRSYAYLRIGEGCDHACSFCAIPSIRGRQRSKPIEVCVAEAEGLASGGVRELVLVAEDSTAYGMDRGRKRTLPRLLEALSEVEGIEWIRVLYAYPHTVDRALIEQLRDNPKVVPYLDIPIQHISASMLRAMKRGVSSEQVRRILDRLRTEVESIAIRTTLLTGFPGESEEDFEELCAFVREFRFERLGVFPYSLEEGTGSFELPGRVPEDVAAERCERILELSRANIEARNAELVGRRLPVLVDGRAESIPEGSGLGEGGSVGRTEADAPEIDCLVYFEDPIPSGTLVEAEITSSLGFDLVARPVGFAGGAGGRS